MKLQKSFGSLLILFVVALSLGEVFAEERVSNLGDITLRFCNDASVEGGTKSLILDTETEKKTDICILLHNNGPTDAMVSLNFVDGSVTADTDQKKACEPEDQKTNFGQYVTMQDKALFIKAGQTLQSLANVAFPAGYAGTSYGCVTYQMLQQTGEQAQANVGMFSIVARRANFIDVNVAGEILFNAEVMPETNSSLQIINPGEPIALYHNLVEKKLKARTILKNSGNIGMRLQSFGYISLFGGIRSTSIPLQEEKILPKQQKSFEITVPRFLKYIGGFVDIGFDFTAYPIGPQGDLNTIEEKNLKYGVSHRFIPRWILVISIIIGWLCGSRLGKGLLKRKNNQ